MVSILSKSLFLCLMTLDISSPDNYIVKEILEHLHFIVWWDSFFSLWLLSKHKSAGPLKSNNPILDTRLSIFCRGHDTPPLSLWLLPLMTGDRWQWQVTNGMWHVRHDWGLGGSWFFVLGEGVTKSIFLVAVPPSTHARRFIVSCVQKFFFFKLLKPYNKKKYIFLNFLAVIS